ncbi:MAG: flagellar motor switch phosphatase FliY [Spirochaetaceae bacterium]|nr:flagellar motor switch phosphatase FliY [Spirochaetaceae bacterium]MCF7947123.1 flagellar motor switch phosphatase FliY [Spirochaetia bacterium]MCF7950124.1 flagellar motor switch phosphatase FliY [Spirochaetaceae bacterium]
MSDGSLSQDEIDALLQGSSMDLGGQEASSSGGGGNAGLSEQEKQQFAQILGQIVQSQGSNLSGMIGETVTLRTPSIELVAGDSAGQGLPDNMVEIKIDFSEGLSGFHSYLLPNEAATTIAGKMMGQTEVELNEAALSALEEAGNTLAGSAATSIGDVIGTTVMTSPGSTKTVSTADVQGPSGQAVKATYSLKIDDEQETNLVELFDLSVVKSILQAGSGGGGQQAAPQAQPQQAGQQMMQQQAMGNQQMGGGQMWGGGQAAFGGQSAAGTQGMGGGGANVQAVQFPNLNPQSGGSEQGNIGLLMDVYMEMTVELGRTRRLIKDILGMGEGTIIELDKLAGEPVDILVNHKLIARGEVVVIDENFGVRVTEIVSPMDRVEGMT